MSILKSTIASFALSAFGASSALAQEGAPSPSYLMLMQDILINADLCILAGGALHSLRRRRKTA